MLVSRSVLVTWKASGPDSQLSPACAFTPVGAMVANAKGCNEASVLFFHRSL